MAMLSYRAYFVMADKSTLQRCESLLEQLPAQVSTRRQNPMWGFLKGIEGFDDTRAAECLGRLLDAHYDTIGVLKLASKQDLVEDARLKAGDALRIVEAAKRVAPRSEPALAAALPWASESYTPACESRRARRKRNRAKTAAQETWGRERQDVIKQADPREEIVISISGGVSLTVPLHACGVCNVVCESQTELRLHFLSMTHAHSMDRVARTGELHTKYFFCSICSVISMHSKDLLSHYNGKQHKKILLPLETPTIPVEAPTIPVEAPTIPVEVPTIPVEVPTIPVEAPTIPVEVPTIPVEAPTIPVEAPTIQAEASTIPFFGATVKIEGSSTLLPHVIGPSPPFSLPMKKPELRDPVSS